MDHPILCLLPSDQRALAAGLRTGHLCPPYPASSVQRMLNGVVAADISTGLQELAASGLPPAGIACALELVATGYENRPPIDDVVDLVTTGGGASGGNRTTSVARGRVVQEALRNRSSLAGYCGVSRPEGISGSGRPNAGESRSRRASVPGHSTATGQHIGSHGVGAGVRSSLSDESVAQWPPTPPRFSMIPAVGDARSGKGRGAPREMRGD